MVTVSDRICSKVTKSDREKVVYLYSINVCHEKNSYRDGHFTRELRNFERDGGRPIAYGMQVLFANHFVRLGGKLTGRERQLEG